MSSRTLDNKSIDMSNCNAVKTASLPPNSKLKKDFTSGTAFKVNVRNSLGRTHSVRNFFNRVVNQTGSGFRTLRRRAVVQASGINTRTIYSIGSGESKKCDDAIEERIAAWKKRFSEDGGKVPGNIFCFYFHNRLLNDLRKYRIVQPTFSTNIDLIFRRSWNPQSRKYVFHECNSTMS